MKPLIPVAALFVVVGLGCGKKGGVGPGLPPSPVATADQKANFERSLGGKTNGLSAFQATDLGVECTLAHLSESFADADMTKVSDPGFAFGIRQQMGALTDAGLAALADRPSLVLLDLQHSKRFTVAGALAVGNMTGLRWLELYDVQATDKWLAAFTPLTALRSLDLKENPGVTDAGLAHLSRMTQLRALILTGTKVTGSGLTALAGAKELARIELHQTTDAGLQAAAKIGKLHALSEAQTAAGQQPKSAADVAKFSARGPVTDDGIKELNAFPNLKELYLDSQKITAASIPFLKALNKLKVLQVLGTAITPDEREALKKALPGCEVR